MSKKILTDELIEEKLQEKGLSMYDQVENSLEKLQNHYEFELTDNYNRTPDYSIYAETTADGYEVFIATSGDGRNICINEDVYYYDSDLSNPLYDAMMNYNELIYVDDLEAYYVQDAVERAWETFIDDMVGEIEDELIEQGYEREKEAEKELI